MKFILAKSTIRSFVPADAESIAKHLGNRLVSRNMSAVPHPYTVQDAHEWIALATSRTRQTHFAIALDGEVIGGIGLEPGEGACRAWSEHSAEIGYWLGEPFWGHGIMSEAVTAFADWAFTELRLVRLHAAVYARNPASARVLVKAGFQPEGRLHARYHRDGEYLDALLYAKVRLPS